MLRSVLIAGILLMAAWAAGAQPGGASVSSIESMIRLQQYDQALDALKIALRSAPGDSRLWTLQGVCFALQAEDQQAIAAFDHALRISPGYVPALKGEIQILYKTGDKRAIPLLERLLKTASGDVTSHEMLAMLEAHNGECKTAVTHFILSKAEVETHPESLAAYGDCLFKLDQTEDAIAVFRQLIPLVPEQSFPSYDLAVLLVDAHRNEEAIKVLDPLLTPDQNDPDILALAAEAYEATGNTPRAVALQRQAIVLDPTDASNYVQFAVICMAHDSYQVGIDMLNAGLQRIPASAALYLSRGVLYVQLADYDKAELDFSRAEQYGAAKGIGAYAGDLTMLQKNDPDTALVKVREQLKTHPDNPLFRLLLAQLIMNKAPAAQSPEFKEAMQNALFAIKAKPDLVDAHNQLASMYMTLGQYDRAILECKTALKYDPDNETAMYHLILSIRHSGSHEDLQPMVKRLAELHQQSLRHETDRKRYRLVEDHAQGEPAR